MNYIYIVIYSLLLIMSLIIEKKCHKRHNTPLLFFVDTWCCVGAIANVGAYGYYLPSDEVNIMISSMIICSILFWLLFNSKNTVHMRIIESNKCVYNYHNNCLLILELVFIILMLPSFVFALKALISGVKMDYLRAYIYDAKNNNGFIEELRGLIAKPIMTLTSLIAVISVFNNVDKRKRIVIWSIAVFNITMYVVSTAGRLPIVNLISYFAISAILYSENRLFSFLFTHKREVILLMVAVCGVLVISAQRSSTTITQSFYIYYFSGPSYLTQILQINEPVFSINHDFMFGSATFGFITNFISYALIFLTHESRGSLYLLGSVLTNESHYVAQNIRVNAMCTCLYDFLVDWGYLGLVLGPMVVMFIAYILLKNDEKHGTLTSKCLLVYYLNILLNSIFKWGLISMEFSMLLLYLFFLEKTSIPSPQKETDL